VFTVEPPFNSQNDWIYATLHGITGIRTRLGDRAGPVVWNSLPAAFREADSLHSFRRKLKTHMFALCFND